MGRNDSLEKRLLSNTSRARIAKLSPLLLSNNKSEPGGRGDREGGESISRKRAAIRNGWITVREGGGGVIKAIFICLAIHFPGPSRAAHTVPSYNYEISFPSAGSRKLSTRTVHLSHRNGDKAPRRVLLNRASAEIGRFNTFETVSVPADRRPDIRSVGVGPFGPTLAIFV